MRRAIILGCLIMATAEADADDDPVTRDLAFDSELRPHPKNPKNDAWVDGDTMIVKLDASRLFPDVVIKDELGQSAGALAPETIGIYVVSTGTGVDQGLHLVQGGCPLVVDDEPDIQAKTKTLQAAQDKDKAASTDTTKADVATAQHALDSARTRLADPANLAVYQCKADPEWSVSTGLRGYVCGDESAAKIAAWIRWHLAETAPGGTENCHRQYDLKVRKRIAKVEVTATEGTNAPKTVTVSHDGGVWSGNVTVTAATRRVTIKTIDEDKNELTTSVDLRVKARDAHSRIRIQSELLATNRFRSLAFSVAVSAVSRAYFDGVTRCFWGCVISPTIVAKLSGEDKTVAQFGFGIGWNIVRGMQANAGLLAGTTDSNTQWRLDRGWFVGIAVDPIVIADILTQDQKK